MSDNRENLEGQEKSMHRNVTPSTQREKRRHSSTPPQLKTITNSPKQAIKRLLIKTPPKSGPSSAVGEVCSRKGPVQRVLKENKQLKKRSSSTGCARKKGPAKERSPEDIIEEMAELVKEDRLRDAIVKGLELESIYECIDDNSIKFKLQALLGVCFQNKGKPKKAKTFFQKALCVPGARMNPDSEDVFKSLLECLQQCEPGIEKIKWTIYYRNLLFVHDLCLPGTIVDLAEAVREYKEEFLQSELEGLHAAVWEDERKSILYQQNALMDDFLHVLMMFVGDKVSRRIRKAFTPTGHESEDESDRMDVLELMETSGTREEEASQQQTDDHGSISQMEVSADTETETTSENASSSKSPLEELSHFAIKVGHAIDREESMVGKMLQLRKLSKPERDYTPIIKAAAGILRGTLEMASGRFDKALTALNEAETSLDSMMSTEDNELKRELKFMVRAVYVRKEIVCIYKSGKMTDISKLRKLWRMEARARNGAPYVAEEYVDLIQPNVVILISNRMHSEGLSVAERETAIDGLHFRNHPLCHLIQAGFLLTTPGLKDLHTNRLFKDVVHITSKHKKGTPFHPHFLLKAFVSYEELYWLLCSLLALGMSSKIDLIQQVIKQITDLYPLRGPCGVLDGFIKAYKRDTPICTLEAEDSMGFSKFVSDQRVYWFRKIDELMKCGSGSETSSNEIDLLDLPLAVAKFYISEGEPEVAAEMLEECISKIGIYSPFSVTLCLEQVLTLWIQSLLTTNKYE